jgi:hypothetical protein
MFFPEPAGALREVARVVTARGTLGVRVFSSLDVQPGPFVHVAARHMRSWSTLSKNLEMSKSTTQSIFQHRCRHTPTASRADLPGR